MAEPLTLRSATGARLNARVDVDPRGLVLHSRSGVDRNRDYRQALELLMTRLDAASINYDIYLDSLRVQRTPLERRRLLFPRQAPISERFSALVNAMNAGSSSKGAWRRILITAPGLNPVALRNAVEQTNATSQSPAVSRLPAAVLRRVTVQDIDLAVARLLNGEETPNFAPSRDFDLIATNGQRLAPKKVFGLALEAALGIEAHPGHFSAGVGTVCFELLEAAGYPVIPKNELLPGNGIEPIDPDLAAAEGRPKLVAHLRRERKPALAAAKRRAMLEQLGHLQCERCNLIPSIALGQHGDAVIEVHHAATQVSDMGDGHVTRLADLMCLCANCHRIVHRELVMQSN